MTDCMTWSDFVLLFQELTVISAHALSAPSEISSSGVTIGKDETHAFVEKALNLNCA